MISCGAEIVARHPRSYEQDDFVFDPIRYLPLPEQKTAGLDQAAPLQGWDLPEEYQTAQKASSPCQNGSSLPPVTAPRQDISHEQLAWTFMLASYAR